MNPPHEPKPSALETYAEVPVWDLPVRLFHWLLAFAIGVSWVSGEILERRDIHYWSGLAVVGLVAFRVLWGFFGSPNTRFKNFVRGPGAALGYLRGAIASRRPSFSIGHNPAGGLMVVALLVVCAFLVLSGLVNTDDVLFDGPLRDDVPEGLASALSAAHEPLGNLLLALIFLHVAVIGLYRFWKRENLVKAMITGRALLPRSKTADQARRSGAHWNLGRALACVLVAAAIPAAIHWMN